jgi:two-component system LytT family response regulator
MNYKVLIVDDELLAREAISLRLQNYQNFTVCAEADNGNDAVLLTESLHPDVVFLDIEMPRMTGIETAKIITEKYAPLIIFVSAYQNYAIDAFRVNAVDYLLKPIKDSHFQEMIDKISHVLKVGNKTAESEKLTSALNNFELDTQLAKPKYLKRLLIDTKDSKTIIDIHNIESFITVKDYICIKVQGEIFIHRCTMKQMQVLVDPSLFIRCHRSHMVNRQYIHRYVSNDSQPCIVTKANDIHPVSRRYKSAVNQFLNNNA